MAGRFARLRASPHTHTHRCAALSAFIFQLASPFVIVLTCCAVCTCTDMDSLNDSAVSSGTDGASPVPLATWSRGHT
jgi:hypothetical protein